MARTSFLRRRAMQRTSVRPSPADRFCRLALLALAALLTLFALVAPAGAMQPVGGPAAGRAVDAASAPKPAPTLSPDSVVATVLAALARNDMPVKDRGISVTFTFSSPANRAFVGPIENFGDLVHDETYRPLLNHRHAERGVARVSGSRATERVVITTASGQRVAYVFALSLQDDGEYKDCWMTDGVTREPPSPLNAMRSAD
jgi:hypothetical protein